MNQIGNLHSRQAENRKKKLCGFQNSINKAKRRFSLRHKKKVMTRKLFFIRRRKRKKNKIFHHRSDEKKFEKVFLFNLNLDLDASEKLSIHVMNGN